MTDVFSYPSTAGPFGCMRLFRGCEIVAIQTIERRASLPCVSPASAGLEASRRRGLAPGGECPAVPHKAEVVKPCLRGERAGCRSVQWRGTLTRRRHPYAQGRSKQAGQGKRAGRAPGIPRATRCWVPAISPVWSRGSLPVRWPPPRPRRHRILGLGCVQGGPLCGRGVR